MRIIDYFWRLIDFLEWWLFERNYYKQIDGELEWFKCKKCKRKFLRCIWEETDLCGDCITYG